MANQYFFSKEIPEKTKGKDIFEITNNYMKTCKLNWISCISICTDGAKSTTGSIKGFVTLIKACNPDLITTHWFLHRETFMLKWRVEDLKKCSWESNNKNVQFY